jgi:cytochrome P450 family 6
MVKKKNSLFSNCFHPYSKQQLSSFSSVTRQVTKDYKVPNSNIVLKNGTMMIIPIYAFHHDPEYFPNPEVFDPDRFSPEEIVRRTSLPFTPFIPFGEGWLFKIT